VDDCGKCYTLWTVSCRAGRVDVVEYPSDFLASFVDFKPVA